MFFRLDRVLAKDVMDENLITLYSHNSCCSAKELLIKNYKKEIFVTDEKNNIKGIITMKDIIKIPYDEAISINTIMSKNPMGVTKDTTLLECRDLMLKHKIGRLAVLEGHDIVGVIREEHIRDYFYMKLEEILVILEHTINNIHEAICVIDNKGHVMIWNDNAEKLYDISKDVIIGEKLDKFFPNAIDTKVLETRQVVKNVYHTPKEGCNIVISAAPIF